MLCYHWLRPPLGDFPQSQHANTSSPSSKTKTKKINSWEIGRIIIIQVTLIKIRKGTSLPVAKL
jgi:hypothetical protein